MLFGVQIEKSHPLPNVTVSAEVLVGDSSVGKKNHRDE